MVQEKKLTALIFKKRDFNFFLVSQILTQLGDKIDYIALIGLIGLYKDKASFYLALMAIFFTAPVFLFGPISGILIDRWNRKKILQISYLIRALLALLLPTIFLISRNIYPAFAIVFFIFLMNLFANTTRLAIIPNLVGQEAILVGNSAVSFVNRAATFVGMLTAGFIIDWPVWKVIFNIEGWQAGFYLDAFCFTVSAFLISFISLKFIPPETKFSILNVKSITQPFKTAYSKIKEALYLCLKNRRVTFALGSIFLLVISASTVYVLAIPTIQIDFNLGTKGVGLLGAIGAIGLILGAFLFGLIGHKFELINAMIGGFIFIGAFVFLFSFIKNFWVLALLSLGAGFLAQPIIIAQDTIIHQEISEKARGRIFGIREWLLNVTFALSAALIGSLSTFITRKYLFIFIGILITCSSIYLGIGLIRTRS